MAVSKRKRLRQIVIKEVSLVDDPANGHARVQIVKHRTHDFDDIPAGGNPVSDEDASLTKELEMNIEELSKALDTAQENLDALTKRADEADTANKTLIETVAARDDEIAKLKGEIGTKPPSDEDFMKSLPEATRKRFEDLAAINKANAEALQKMADEKDEAVFIAKAASFRVGDAKAIGPVLHRIVKNKTTAEDVVALETLLKGLGEQVAKGNLFKVVGGSAIAEPGDVESIAKAKAADLMKADPAMPAAQAIAKVWTDNPQLYADYIAKRRSTGIQ